MIAASSVHRKDGIAAVDHAISTLKARVPIWKKVLSISFFVCVFRLLGDLVGVVVVVVADRVVGRMDHAISTLKARVPIWKKVSYLY